MNSAKAALVQDILAFDIDGKAIALPFVLRLCEEYNWDRALAEQAISEYKRFMALAAVCAHPVTPSRVVDKVWHFHLTYTDSYWNRLCRDIIRRPIHHTPTEGGPEEDLKYLGQYQKTLAAYAELFGEEPPENIWPRPRLGSIENADPDSRLSFEERWLRMSGMRQFFALAGFSCMAAGFIYLVFSSEARNAPIGYLFLLLVGAGILFVSAARRPSHRKSGAGAGAANTVACGTASCGLWDFSGVGRDQADRHHSDHGDHGCDDPGGGDSGDSSCGSTCGSSCGGGCGGGD